MQPQLEIHMLPVAALVPYAGNAKEHPAKQVHEIAASMREFGNCDPIAVWHNAEGQPEIVEGHGRLLALRELGIEEAPVIYLDHLTDEQRRAYTHVHNQTTLSSGFDLDALAADMAALDFDWEAFGFDSSLAVETAPGEVEETPVPEDAEPVCRRGEVWVLGRHRLMCGDATSAEDMAALCGGGTVDALITDPPYGVAYDGTRDKVRQEIANDRLTGSDLEAFLTAALSNAATVMRDGAAFYIWHASMNTPAFRRAAAAAGLDVHQVLVWVKSNFVLGRADYQWKHELCLYGWKGEGHWFADSRRETTVLDDVTPDLSRMTKDEMRRVLEEVYSDRVSTTVIYESKPADSAEHPTMKPVKLIARHIANSTGGGVVRAGSLRRERHDARRVRADGQAVPHDGARAGVLRRHHRQMGAAHGWEGGQG